MSLTTDRVRPSQLPNSWRIGSITAAGVILGACFLAFCAAVLAIGKFEMRLSIEALRTLSVVAIAFGLALDIVKMPVFARLTLS